jgi:hypothetical protein
VAQPLCDTMELTHNISLDPWRYLVRIWGLAILSGGFLEAVVRPVFRATGWLAVGLEGPQEQIVFIIIIYIPLLQNGNRVAVRSPLPLIIRKTTGKNHFSSSIV